ncbi:uncharacterized protein LOC109535069 isoform X1 [Dendroctonus ponderosae]|uniref:KIF-binding protein n=1 Tax=Dendroctonus ponderosae TaxID=77166 RepID=U4UMS1_DENPD|nr:uncharacterized protein LOC109535069 isoform X1 [Dendroctonus ponderosae]ERL94412.1 hypothetical protein D910_11690 [Dendroctonus ponderosae]
MAENSEFVLVNDLQSCFNDLKKHSVSFKLGQAQPTVGDEMHNPLHQQFELILTKIEETLAKQHKDSEEYLKVISMKASIIYEKAKILLSENLLTPSKTLLEESLELIKDFSDHPKVAFLHMRVVNHLTYVLSRLGFLQEAKELLLRAIEEETKCSPEVFSTDDLFLNTKKDPKVSVTKLNRLTINNMQMLAWIHARLGETEDNLKVQHDILQKQLDSCEGDVLRWAESCFRLGGMFIGQCDWPNAMYHLIAAESILNPLEVALIPNPEIHVAQADLARSWIYYGLQLFESSRKSLISKHIESDGIESEVLKKNSGSSESSSPKNPYHFQGLEIELPKAIPTGLIKNCDQAKGLFAYLQKWMKRVRLYYTLRDFPLQYVNSCLDLSELYRFVAFYEEDIESQYAVQKRRYDALETLSNILREVRPSCYLAVSVELTKELIEVQIEMINLNLKKLHRPTQGVFQPFHNSIELIRYFIGPNFEAKEDVLKKQMYALSAIHGKLNDVALSLNTSTEPSSVKDSEEAGSSGPEANEEKTEKIEDNQPEDETEEIKKE